MWLISIEQSHSSRILGRDCFYTRTGSTGQLLFILVWKFLECEGTSINPSVWNCTCLVWQWREATVWQFGGSSLFAVAKAIWPLEDSLNSSVEMCCCPVTCKHILQYSSSLWSQNMGSWEAPEAHSGRDLFLCAGSEVFSPYALSICFSLPGFCTKTSVGTRGTAKGGMFA